LNIVINYYLVSTGNFKESSLIPMYIFINMLGVVPLAYYIFFIRKKLFPFSTLYMVYLLTSSIAYALLKDIEPNYLKYILYMGVVAEIFVLLYLLYKIKKIILLYKEEKKNSFFLCDTVESVAQKNFSHIPIFSFIVLESLIWFYAFFGWFMRYTPSRNEIVNSFTYYKTTLYKAFFWVFMFAFLIETPLIHFLLLHWSITAAWIVTVSTVYGLVWFIGDYNMIKHQPVVLTSDKILIRLGMRSKVDIELSNILDIQNIAMPTEDIVTLSLMSGDTNVYLVFRNPVKIRGAFGKKKTVSDLNLYLDNPSEFVSKVKERI